MSKHEIVILGYLKIKPMYGYEILKNAKKRELNVWANIKKSSIYKILKRFEEKNLIIGKKRTIGNNPPRRVFELTESGLNYFRKILYEFLESSVKCNNRDFLIGITFMNKALTKDFVWDIIEQRIGYLNEIVDSLPKHLEEQKCEDQPFYIDNFHNQFIDILRLNIKTLTDILEKSKLKENEDTFYKEN